MKKAAYVLIATLAVAPAWADSASDLLAAQTAYQQALKAANNHSAQTIILQERLTAAEQRASAAQAEAAGLRSELAAITQQNNTYQSNLNTAGEQLDAAWAAAQSSNRP